MALKSVSALVLDGLAVFEFGVICEVFGIDRSTDGVPNFDFKVCGPEPGKPLRTSVGAAITPVGTPAAASSRIASSRFSGVEARGSILRERMWSMLVTDSAYIINEGRIFRGGTPEALERDPEVKRVYLGESFTLRV